MFFQFRQNNSGGYFVHDDKRGISVEVWVEADDEAEAVQRAEEIGLYFDGAGDCPCCGDRWYSSCWDSQEEPPAVVRGYTKWMKGDPEGYVHFKNGVVYSMAWEKRPL